MTCEYIGKQWSSGEGSGIVTGRLEIELTGATTVLHDAAAEHHPHSTPIRTAAHRLMKGSSTTAPLNRIEQDRMVENLEHYE
jgi:hypothetical protein